MHRWLILGLSVVLVGCDLGQSGVEIPKMDPSSIAKAALQQYDGNSDGVLDAGELKESAINPKKGWDADNDGKVSEEELRTRLERYEQLKPGIQGFTCRVVYRGEGLEGAEVQFEPEEFYGGSVEAAVGVTDSGGVATMEIPELVAKDARFKGIRPAMYKVRITHPEAKIGEKYNTNTTLTFELSPVENIVPPTFTIR